MDYGWISNLKHAKINLHMFNAHVYTIENVLYLFRMLKADKILSPKQLHQNINVWTV